MTQKKKQLEAHRATLVKTIVNRREIHLPIVNHLSYTVDLLARRTMIVQALHMITEPYTKPLSYQNIQKPEGLDPRSQDELLALVNEFRTCITLNIAELGCTVLGQIDVTLKLGS